MTIPPIVSDTVLMYRPGWKFPSVSVTGRSCELMCDHCKGHYLASMVDVSEEGALLQFGLRHWDKGGIGFLLSGGCDRKGAVPYPDHILRDLRSLKRETGLVINVHPGLLGEMEALSIAETGVDVFSFDVVTDPEVLKKVMHLHMGKEDVVRSLQALNGTGVRVVPHVLAGLSPVTGPGEMDSIDTIGETRGDMAVLIVHIPTRGTPMANRAVRTDVVRTIARYMVERLTDRSLVLGCMRPRGDPGLERDLLSMGFSGIVQPRRSTVEWVRDTGSTVKWITGCCAPFPGGPRRSDIEIDASNVKYP